MRFFLTQFQKNSFNVFCNNKGEQERKPFPITLSYYKIHIELPHWSYYSCLNEWNNLIQTHVPAEEKDNFTAPESCNLNTDLFLHAFTSSYHCPQAKQFVQQSWAEPLGSFESALTHPWMEKDGNHLLQLGARWCSKKSKYFSPLCGWSADIT